GPSVVTASAPELAVVGMPTTERKSTARSVRPSSRSIEGPRSVGRLVLPARLLTIGARPSKGVARDLGKLVVRRSPGENGRRNRSARRQSLAAEGASKSNDMDESVQDIHRAPTGFPARAPARCFSETTARLFRAGKSRERGKICRSGHV